MALRLANCLTLCLLVVAVLAAPALAGWEDDLVEQIEHDCEVVLLSRVMEQTVEGREVVRARVHCSDNRSFDAFRPDEFDPFQFIERKNGDA
jgi:hypothetical protein